MCEPRAKTLLQSLHSEFELLQAQNEALNWQNISLAVTVAKLQAQLEQNESDATAIDKTLEDVMVHRLALLEGCSSDHDGKTVDAVSNSAERMATKVVIVSPADEQRLETDGAQKKSAPSVLDQASRAVTMSELWPAWQEESAGQGSQIMARRQDYLSKKTRYGAEFRTQGILQCLVSRPSSPRQIVWDIFSILFMSMDVLMVPMQAFPIPQTNAIKVLDWVTLIFWSLDILNSFFTGYHQNGIHEMRPGKIAKRYIRKMFVVDFLIVLADWIVVSLDQDFKEYIGVVRILKSCRVARICRMLRLIRVVRFSKMRNTMVQLAEHVSIFQSTTTHVLLDISKLFLFMLLASHFVACGWYAIGTTESFGDTGVERDHWVEEFAAEHGGEPTLGYRYVTALHWSLTQFTPASMEVVPRNVWERIYAVVVLLLAVVAFSSIVSSITSSMTHLRMMNMDQAKERNDVSKYILDHKMTLSMGNRINQFLSKRGSMKVSRIHEEHVSLFRCLPEALRVDVHREVFLPVLCSHPFFRGYYELLDDVGLSNICHTAMHERTSISGEGIFNIGETATHMFFMQSGSCEYSCGVYPCNDVVDVGPDGKLSEAVLWVPWEHVGRLIAVKHVEYTVLDSAAMQGALRGQPAAISARTYALQFLDRQLKRGGVTDLGADADDATEFAQLAWSDSKSSLCSDR